MTLNESIYLRRSVRKFKMEAVYQDLLKEIMSYQKEVMKYDQELKTEFQLIDCLNEDNKVKGIFSVKAPYYLAIYSEEHENMFLNAGYIMEQVVLFLHSKGLGSCYLGSVKPEEKEQLVMFDKKFVILIAFGKPEGELSRLSIDAKRLPTAKLSVFKDEMKKTQRLLLEAGRFAPSAMNIQPWRFVVYQNRIHIFVKHAPGISRLMRRWDEISVGAMLSHLMITSEDAWLEASFVKAENITHKNVPNNRYVVSVVWK